MGKNLFEADDTLLAWVERWRDSHTPPDAPTHSC